MLGFSCSSFPSLFLGLYSPKLFGFIMAEFLSLSHQLLLHFIMSALYTWCHVCVLTNLNPSSAVKREGMGPEFLRLGFLESTNPTAI